MKSVSTIIPRDLAKEVKILLLRSSPIIYNVSNISSLLNISHPSGDTEVELKRKLLDNISKVNPTIFKDQVRMLKDSINEYEESNTGDNNLTINETLKTLYKISKVLKEQIDFDDSFFLTKLNDIALEGKPMMAKYATKIICMSPAPDDLLTRIKKYILPLDREKDNNFTAHVIVLMEIFKFHPHILDEDSTDIVSYLIKDILLSNEVVGNQDNDSSWVTDSQLDESKYYPLANKIFALKLFTNKLRAIAGSVNNDDLAKTFAEKTVKLVFYLIASGGELISENNTENYPTPDAYQTKLRCYSGLQLLKLAKIPKMQHFIKSADVIKLVNIVEDESLPVRKTFLDHLKEYIGSELISIKFLPLIFFTTYEPDKELKKNTKTWINYTFSKPSFKKGTFFERILPRLIHAIAHHPDIVEGLQQTGEAYLNALTTSVDYLIFYFDSIATQENFNLLYYLSERVKNYRDRVAEEESKEEEEEEEKATDGDDVGKENKESVNLDDNPLTRMYIISELSQMILLKLKERKDWQHSAYPGKLNLPGDVFKPFNSIQEAQASFKPYLNETYTEKLENNIRAKVGRIVHSSQTHRQRVQKRMLASEYHGPDKKKRRQKGMINADSSSDSEGDDRAVHAPLRKNLRERKNIDYQDDDSESEQEEE